MRSLTHSFSTSSRFLFFILFWLVWCVCQRIYTKITKPGTQRTSLEKLGLQNAYACVEHSSAANNSSYRYTCQIIQDMLNAWFHAVFFSSMNQLNWRVIGWLTSGQIAEHFKNELICMDRMNPVKSKTSQYHFNVRNIFLWIISSVNPKKECEDRCPFAREFVS